MKCICGYENKDGFVNGEWVKNIIGDEEFIKIEGSTFKKSIGIFETKEIYLYACPKCGTVKIKIDDDIW